jgi:hypothetical protein
MSSSRDAVRCTVHHGDMWMHLDNVSVKIPPELVKNSQLLTDALSAAHPSFARKVTVAVPKEWLQAWAKCYCNKEVSLGCGDIKDLVNCLLVWVSCPWNVALVVLTTMPRLSSQFV